MDDEKKPPKENEEETHDPVIPYLITAIYAAFTMYIFSFYITDRKWLIMLYPVAYLFWYAMMVLSN